jgi:hypothetical protein
MELVSLLKSNQLLWLFVSVNTLNKTNQDTKIKLQLPNIFSGNFLYTKLNGLRKQGITEDRKQEETYTAFTLSPKPRL